MYPELTCYHTVPELRYPASPTACLAHQVLSIRSIDTIVGPVIVAELRVFDVAEMSQGDVRERYSVGITRLQINRVLCINAAQKKWKRRTKI